jgi:TnpA family transposase
MARQRLLGEAIQARLLGLPADEREMVRHATLGSEDFALIAQRRGEANQLGFALMLVCLRHPGRVLATVFSHLTSESVAISIL